MAPSNIDTKRQPFKKTEATVICQKYQSLVDELYYEDGKLLGRIECVAVAPFDEINKWIFINNYMDCGDPFASLDFYQVPFFDVILVIEPENANVAIEKRRLYRDTHTWLNRI